MRALLVVAFAALALPAAAQDKDGAPQKEEKKICRSVATTGTILGGKRECHTKAEWDKIAEKSREDRERYDRDTTSRSTGSVRDD